MAPAPSVLKVFLVDEHEVVRRGVAAIVGDEDDMTITGQADTVRGALLRVPAAKPDVVILGALFAIGDGVELCRDLRERVPGQPCLLLTSASDPTVMLAALLAGAAGVVEKSITATALVEAIRVVGSGNALLDRRAAGAMIEALRRAPAPADPFDNLTESEHQILACLGEGLTNGQIAARMYVADKTVKNYVSRVLAKLGVSSRTQAALAYVTENAPTQGSGRGRQ